MIIDDKVWNLYHDVPKEETLKFQNVINTRINCTAFTVKDKAKDITLTELNNYDIVIFNYCDNLYHAAGTPFETSLREWFAQEK